MSPLLLTYDNITDMVNGIITSVINQEIIMDLIHQGIMSLTTVEVFLLSVPDVRLRTL